MGRASSGDAVDDGGNSQPNETVHHVLEQLVEGLSSALLAGPELAFADEDVAVAFADQDVGLAAAVEEFAAGLAFPVAVQRHQELVAQLLLAELVREVR